MSPPMPNTPTSLRDLAHRNGVSPESVASRLGITEADLELFHRGLATISTADLPTRRRGSTGTVKPQT